MSWLVVGSIAVGVVGAAASADAQKSAGNKAADAQERAAQLGVDENRRQFDQLQELLAPYAEGGEEALGYMRALSGAAGPEQEAEALRGVRESAEYRGMVEESENALLQNASATGGLRGGNIQQALASNRQQLLDGLTTQRFNRLGTLASAGQNAAAMTGNAGMQTAGAVSDLYGQQGAARAGQALAHGEANQQMINSATQAYGMWANSRGKF